jgi:protein SCO1/2
VKSFVAFAFALSLAACGPEPWTRSAAPALAPALESTTWTDDHEQPVSLATWRGSPVVLTMFYSSCQLRCPTTLLQLEKLEAELPKTAGVHYVLVTLDPRNDTPWRLAEYKKEHHLADASWHLLAGDLESTQRLSRALGLHAAFDEGCIDHQVRVVLLDRQGAFVRDWSGWTVNASEVAALL